MLTQTKIKALQPIYNLFILNVSQKITIILKQNKKKTSELFEHHMPHHVENIEGKSKMRLHVEQLMAPSGFK